MKEQFYPTLEKHRLSGIYLAEYSPHTRGVAVDLTLCTLEGKQLDMGTQFDFFSQRSWHNATGLTEHQKENRQLLRSVMQRAGFEPYSNEWWHYTYSRASASTFYDFIVAQ